MSTENTEGSTRRRNIAKDVIITAICAVLLAAGAVYFIFFRPSGEPAQGAFDAGVTPGTSTSAPGQPSGISGTSPGSNPKAPGPVSGAAMPQGDLPGWRQTLADDFTGTQLSDDWGPYRGQPAGDPGGWFDPNHVKVVDGELVIVGKKEDTPNGRIYATGGVGSENLSQVYGKFEVRFRMDKGRGIQFNHMLWPTDDNWPPEINFAEDDGKERKNFGATLHYGPPHKTISRDIEVDTTQWHTVGLEWTPGKLTYLLDGKVWATMETSHSPTVPMSIAIQTQAWQCGTQWAGCPNSSTPPEVNLHVDWVTAYERR